MSSTIEHKRSQFIDDLISNTEEILTDKAVERHLTEETCAKFLSHINHLLIPNIRDNKIILPSEYENKRNFIPFIAFNSEDDTELYIDHENLVNQTNQQYNKSKEYLAGFMELHNKPEGVVDMLNAINDEMYSRILDNNLVFDDTYFDGAIFHSHFVTEIFCEKTGNRRSKYFEGKPSVMIPIDKNNSGYTPLTFIHELAHCDTVIKNPYGKPPGKKTKVDKYNLYHELIAHHIEVATKNALYNESDNPKFRENDAYKPSEIDIIEKLRMEHNDENNPYESKTALARDLRDKTNLDFFF